MWQPSAKDSGGALGRCLCPEGKKRKEEEMGSAKAVDDYWRFARPLMSLKVEENGGYQQWEE